MTTDSEPAKPVAKLLRPDPVIKEFRELGLSRDEKTRLGQSLDRLRRGDLLPGDVKKLKGPKARGVEELRIRLHRRIGRFYFSRLDGDLVLLALHVNIKKTNNDRPAVDLAIERLKKYKRGEWGR